MKDSTSFFNYMHAVNRHERSSNAKSVLRSVVVTQSRRQERSGSIVVTYSKRQERTGSVEEARWLILVICWNRRESVSSVARTYVA